VFESKQPARVGHLGDDATSAAAFDRQTASRSSAGAPISLEGRLWGLIAVGSIHEAGLPQGIERELAGFTELVATAIANTDAREQLLASRARVLAAADEARRRIERDLHDGVQQRLVALGLQLHAAHGMAQGSPVLNEQLSQLGRGLASVLFELREISTGVHPAILRHGGLRSAIRALARLSPVPVELDLTEDLSLGDRAEVAAYYVVSEALTNVAKHAQASSVEICVRVHDSQLELMIRDDGVGGATTGAGSGLIGLADRVEAIGGRIQIISPPGEGTTLNVTLPCAPAATSPALDPA
jgi:signal transduction histidine kinase